jgi:hypothetical protein
VRGAGFLSGLLAALTPQPWRDRLAAERGIDVPRFSLALGLLQLVAGVLLFLSGGISYVRGGALVTSFALLENWSDTLSTTDFQGGGLVNWIAWFLHPIAWLTGFVALTGLVRCVAFVATRETVAEPVVWLGLRLYETTRRRRRTADRLRTLGPLRPDRIVEEDAGQRVLLTCRERPEIREGVTVEIDGRFYALDGIEERPDGEWTILAYRLREQGEGAVIRKLLRLG